MTGDHDGAVVTMFVAGFLGSLCEMEREKKKEGKNAGKLGSRNQPENRKRRQNNAGTALGGKAFLYNSTSVSG